MQLPRIADNTFVISVNYCPFFFSVTRPGRTVAPILTLNDSNDVFPPKDGPFGVGTMGDIMRGKYVPKTPQKGHE